MSVTVEGAALVDTSVMRAWLEHAARVIEDQRDHLTHLDSAIGDADHGLNLTRGFTAVVATLADRPTAKPGELLVAVGGVLISKVGGASGPLYGTAFRRAGKALGDTESLDTGDVGAAFDAALRGVQELGAAVPGDKTMVDALAPAVAAYHEAAQGGAGIDTALRRAADAAQAGAEATVPMQARKGRASYLGPRSVGHQDPGATSTALILAALATVVAGNAP